MVVSRDVTFDEKKTWQWTSTNETLLEQPGTFKIMFLGDHGNQGIRDDDKMEKKQSKAVTMFLTPSKKKQSNRSQTMMKEKMELKAML